MKIVNKLTLKQLALTGAIIVVLGLLAFVREASAQPPYDVTATFDPAPGATSYNLYVDDCAATGPVGAPVTTAYVSGTPVSALLTTDGTFQVCIRAVNATAQENPDPGPVATITVGPLGTIQNLQIIIGCPNGPCVVSTVIS